MIEQIAMFIAGLLFLVIGSKFLVNTAARLAKKLNVSDFIIGMTFIAVGTSIPELSSVIFAAREGYPQIILGTIIGSNIANIGLIFGLSAIAGVMIIKKDIFGRDGYLLALSAVLIYAFTSDGVLSIVEAIMLLFIYVVYMLFLIRTRRQAKNGFLEFIRYFFGLKYLMTSKSTLIGESTLGKKKVKFAFQEGLIKDFIVFSISLLGILLGAEWVVEGAVWIAGQLGVSNGVIAVTLIALGTSLPELFVSISAVRRGLGEVVVGNIVGSNIANSLLVFALSIVGGPVVISEVVQIYLVPLMAFITVVFVYMIRIRRIPRWMGVLLLLFYAGFISFAVFQGII